MEQWKFIKNSSYYQVSNLGRIKCIGGTIIRKDGKPYTIKEKIMKPTKTRHGYLLIELKIDLHEKFLVHRLVLETFNPIENMKNLQVNHIDGDKSNNHIKNLEWVTRTENMQHAIKTGLFHPENRCGEKHPLCQLTEMQISEIKEKLKENKRGLQHQLALEYGVSDTTISEIKTGRKRKLG